MEARAAAVGGQFPSLGGVAVAKRLTGWSVAFPHTLKKTTPALRATPPKEGNWERALSTGSFENYRIVHKLRFPRRIFGNIAIVTA